MDKCKYIYTKQLYNTIVNKQWFNKSELTISSFIDDLLTTFHLTQLITIKMNEISQHDTIQFHHINPFIWDYGNILYFWEHRILKNNNTISDPPIYDPTIIKPFSRVMLYQIGNVLLSFDTIQQCLNKIRVALINELTEIDISLPINQYFLHLIRIGQLYQDSVNERFLYSSNLQSINIFQQINTLDEVEPILDQIQMIQVQETAYLMGSNETMYDNAAPPFMVALNKFAVSKYPITNYMYLQFINAGGYTNNKYWTFDGWNWISRNKLVYPLYWQYNNIWYEKVFDKYIPLRLNNPVINISWYEAYAFSSWKGCRLLKESEWEYLASMSNKETGHLSSSILSNKNETMLTNSNTISVMKDKNISSNGVVGLFGNCWEWCFDICYPYDGFVKDLIDPMTSCQLFGNRVCRGGSWATSKNIVSTHYRKAIDPECCIEYTGFRVAI